jgi:hypothetical protein
LITALTVALLGTGCGQLDSPTLGNGRDPAATDLARVGLDQQLVASPDGRSLLGVIGNSSRIALLRADSVGRRALVWHRDLADDEEPAALAFAPDGRFVVAVTNTATRSSTAQLHDGEGAALGSPIALDQELAPNDGSAAIVGSGDDLILGTVRDVDLLRIDLRTGTTTSGPTPVPTSGFIATFRGQLVVAATVAGSHGPIGVVDATTGTELATLPHAARLFSVAGGRLVSSGESPDGVDRVLDEWDGTTVAPLRAECDGRVVAAGPPGQVWCLEHVADPTSDVRLAQARPATG